MLIVLHVGGIILFSIVPLLVSGRRWFEAVVGIRSLSGPDVFTVAALVIVAIVVAPRIADKNHRRLFRGYSVNDDFGIQFIINYFFLRIFFLVAYEAWFRGCLINSCIAYGNVPLAIVINIVLYAALHLVNGRSEVVACLPFGLLLCTFSIWMNAAWPAILIHTVFTLSYEIHLVKKYNHPSTSFV